MVHLKTSRGGRRGNKVRYQWIRRESSTVYVVPLLRDHPSGPVKGGFPKEVISGEGKHSIGHIYTFETSRAGLTKGVVSQKVRYSTAG